MPAPSSKIGLLLFAALLASELFAQAAVMVPSAGPFRMRASQPIEDAAVKGDDEEVKRLFAGARPEARYGALDIALRKKEFELAAWLLKQGVHPTANPPGQYDALGSAAEAGNIPAIELLCRYKADANKPGFFNARPLHRAINSRVPNRLETVRALLACGADPRIRDQELYRESGKPGLQPGDDPTLIDAIYTRDTELVRLLLDHGTVIEESAECCAERLLLIAVHEPDMLKLLLERGGAKAIPGPLGAKLLGYVVCAGHPDQDATLTALRTLLALKAPVNDWYHGDTPLMCAAEKVEVEVVKLLLDAGADIRIRKPHGHRETAVAEAIDVYQDPREVARRQDISEGKAKERAISVVKLFLARGISPEDEEEIWRAARQDDEMGRLLSAGTQAWYAQLVRECLVNAPRDGTARLKVSPPAAKPDRVYSPALVTFLNELPAPSWAATFSPDGRWMAYETGDSGDDAVLYSLVASQAYRFDGSDRLEWSADSKALSLGRAETVVNLAAKPPALMPRKGFLDARRPGEAPCIEQNKDGKTWPRADRQDPGEHPYSPDLTTRYEVVGLTPMRHVLVAEKDGKQEQLLVHDVTVAFREQQQREKAEMEVLVERLVREHESRGADPKKVRHQLREAFPALEPEFEAGGYLPSPTGRYLYYSITPDRPLRDKQQSQQLVVDVNSRPVRVWEIDAEVMYPSWHPNGRELWFITSVGPETGPPMRRERGRGLAAVAFPE